MSDAKKTPTNDVKLPQTQAELRKVLERAQDGDEKVLPVVQRLLENPAHVTFFGGDLAGSVVDGFAEAIAEDDIGRCEAVRRKLELLRAELLGDNPTPIERMLVERVVACWLQLQEAELRYAQDPTITYGDDQRCLDSITRRFLASVRALLVARKMSVPTVQINVNEQANAGTLIDP